MLAFKHNPGSFGTPRTLASEAQTTGAPISLHSAIGSRLVEVFRLRGQVYAGRLHDLHGLGLLRGKTGEQGLEERRALHVADHGRLLDACELAGDPSRLIEPAEGVDETEFLRLF